MEQLFLIAAVTVFITALIAHTKGKSFFLWWLYGMFFFLVTLPHSLLVLPYRSLREARETAGNTKKCPNCAEMTKAEAIV
jgi:hypothetical protein